MNDHALPPIGVNFTISNRPAAITTWTPGASVNSGTANHDLRNSVEGISGEGSPASGSNQKDYRIRYQANHGNRGAFAGAIEALKCAFGISDDGAFCQYVMDQRKKLRSERQALIDTNSNQ